MKPKGKKTLAVTIGLALVAALLIAMVVIAGATTPHTTRSTALNLANDTWKTETGVVESPTGTWTNEAEGWTVAIDGATYTITLDGVNFSGAVEGPLLNLPAAGTINVVCTADSTIANTSTPTGMNTAMGIAIFLSNGGQTSPADVTFSGSGKLTLNTSGTMCNALSMSNGTINVTFDSANIDASGQEGSGVYISADGTTKILGTSSIKSVNYLNTVGYEPYEVGMFINNSLEIAETATVFASGYVSALQTMEAAATVSANAKLTGSATFNDSAPADEIHPAQAGPGAPYGYYLGSSGTETQALSVLIAPPDPVVEVSHTGAAPFTSFTSFDEGWQEALGANNTANTTLRLKADWVADETAGFGSDTSYYVDGALYCKGASFSKKGYLTLDLNGHKIDRNLTAAPTVGGSVIRIDDYAVLVIQDSVGGGQITGGYAADGGGGIAITTYGTTSVTLKSGEISGNVAMGNGGGVYIKNTNATFTMEGGKICANESKQSMSKDNGGGGVNLNCGNFIMSGGEISNNISVAKGGGVTVASNSPCNMTLSGAVKIINNYQGGSLAEGVASGGTANNLYYATYNNKLTFGGPLTGGAAIGINHFNSGGAVFANATDPAVDYSAYFTSDSPDFKVIYNSSNQLQLKLLPIFKGYNGQTITADNYATASWTSHGVTYTLEGWYSYPNGMGTKLTGAPVDGSTYHAHWKRGDQTVITALPIFRPGMDVTELAQYVPADSGIAWANTGSSAGTLTLTDAIIDNSNGSDIMCVMFMDNSEDSESLQVIISLVGDSAIYGGFQESEGGSAPIVSQGSIEFKGEGSLLTQGADAAAVESDPQSMGIMCGALTFSDSVQVTAHGGNMVSSTEAGRQAISVGIFASSVLVQDSAVVIAQGGSATNTLETADVNSSISMGVAGSVTVSGGSLTASGGSAVLKDNVAASSIAINGSLTTNGGITTLSGAWRLLNDYSSAMADLLTVNGSPQMLANTSNAEGTIPYSATDFNSYKWLNISYVPTITFDNRGGSETAAMEIDLTAPPTAMPANPTWGSYQFEGWYTEIDGAGTKVDLTALQAYTTPATLYAHWQVSAANSQTVRTQPLDLSAQTSPLSSASQGWSWSDNTLTLNGAVIDCSGADSMFAVLLPTSGILKLADNTANTIIAGQASGLVNNVTVLASLGVAAFSNAAGAVGTIILTGNGSLSVDSADVNSATTAAASCAVYAGVTFGDAGNAPSLTARGGAAVCPASGSPSIYAASYGVGMAIMQNGVLNASAGTATGNHAYSLGLASLSQSGGQVTAKAATATIQGTPNEIDYSAGVGEFGAMTNGTLRTTGQDYAVRMAVPNIAAQVLGSASYDAATNTLTAAKLMGNAGIKMGEAGDGAMALTALLSFPPTVSGAVVAAADGEATFGAAAAVKNYTATFTNFTNATDKEAVWCDVNGATANAAQAGSGLAISGTAVTFTTSPTADAGTYYFKVGAKENAAGETVYSAPIAFVINKAEATAAMMTASGNVSKYGKAAAALTLPTLPKNAAYGTPVAAVGAAIALSELSVSNGALIYTAAASTAGEQATVTIPVPESTNYNAYDVTVTITSINKLTVTITNVQVDGLTDGAKVYDGAAASYSGIPAAANEGTPASIPADGFAYAWSQADDTPLTAAPKTVGDYRLTVSVKESDELYEGSLVLAFSITAKPLSISGLNAPARAYDAGTAVALSGGTLEGRVGLDDVSVAMPSSGTIPTAAVGNGKAVTVAQPELTGTDKGNYTLDALPAITVNITPAPITVTGPGTVAVTKPYDGAASAGTLTGKLAFSGIVGTEDVSLTTIAGPYTGVDVGSGKTVTLTLGLAGADKANYQLAAPTYAFTAATITKADYSGPALTGAMNVIRSKAAAYSFDLSALDLPAGFKSVTYSAPAIGANADGLLSGTPTLTGAVLGFNVTAAPEAGLSGALTVTLSSLNYNDTPAAITVTTVAKTPVTLSGLAVSGKTYDGAAAAYSGTPVAKTAANETVTIPSTDYAYAWSLADGTALAVAPVNAGAYKLTVSVKDSNEQYEGAAEFSFTIIRKAVVVSADDQSMVADAKLPEYTVSYKGFLGSDTPATALTTLAVADCSANGKTAGKFTITFKTEAVLNDTVGANYALTHQDGTLTVKEAQVEEEVFNAALSGGAVAKNLSYTLSGQIATLRADTAALEAVLDASNNNGVIELDLTAAKQNIDAVRLPAAFMKKVAAAVLDKSSDAASLLIALPTGSVSFDRDALQTLNDATSSSGLVIRIEEADNLTAAQQQAVGNCPVYQVTATGKNGLIHDLNGWVEITLPYEKTVADATAVRVFWLDSSAKLHQLDAKYDAKTKTVTFSVNHLTLFAISYASDLAGWRCPYTDVNANHWFYSYVRDLSLDGVVNGYPDATFKPQGQVTYGEALKLILMATGYGQQFRTGAHWASGYLSRAQADGLIGSVVNLNAPISRETVAEAAAKAMKLPAATNASAFGDTANAGVLALYEAGIVEGNFDTFGNRLYHPSDNITRAEVTTIIWRINEYAQ